MEKKYYQTKYVVTESDSGKKLQLLIQEHLAETISLKKIKNALENNCCLVNGVVERYASYRVKKGDLIQFNLDFLEKKTNRITFSKTNILYEDSNFLIYNKPAGITSEEDGLFTLLLKYNSNLEKVHRLDKETSGAIIYAKSKEIQTFLIQAFKDKLINKHYIAIVDGPIKDKNGVIDQPIGKICTIENQSIWGILAIKNGGKEAITKWKSIAISNEASLIYCYPVTGRTHQIRVHLQLLGNPILGDKIYRKKYICTYPAERQFLHSYILSFPSLNSKRQIEVTAPLPLDMIEAMKYLFKIDSLHENFDS